jgi:DNA-binding NtrC family response regulator
MAQFEKVIILSSNEEDLLDYEKFVANKQGRDDDPVAPMGSIPIVRYASLERLWDSFAGEDFYVDENLRNRLEEAYVKSTTPSAYKLRVLAVDDKKWIRDYLKCSLAFQRYILHDLRTGKQILVLIHDLNREIDIAPDRETAAPLFMEKRHRVVFTDLWMPDAEFRNKERSYHWDSPSVVIEATDEELVEGSQGINLIREILEHAKETGLDGPQIVPFSSHWEDPRIKQLFAQSVYSLCRVGIMPKHYSFEYAHRSTFDDVLNSILLSPELSTSTYNTFLNILRFGIEEMRRRDRAIRNLISVQSRLVGESEEIRKIKNEIVNKVAPLKVSVLLTGESGTGKEVIANLIHDYSPRKDMPLVSIDCTAIPASLLESELFGYEKGAFTDAKARKEGLFERAAGGTLFLDEIGELELSLQAKLLKVLEQGVFRRLGGLNDITLNARIVAATNRKLLREVEEGRFRLDLYYRLNVINYELPPLRERTEDILALARHFIRKTHQNYGVPSLDLSNDTEQLLLKYPWPGNIRELRNVIERAMILAAGDATSEITPNYLPPDLRNSTGNAKGVKQPTSIRGAAHYKQDLDSFNKQYIIMALEETGNNKKKAAQLLGISRGTLDAYMEKYRLGLNTDLIEEA